VYIQIIMVTKNSEVVSIRYKNLRQDMIINYKRCKLRCIASSGRPTSRQSFWPQYISLPNFSTIGQWTTELLTIQHFPPVFRGLS